MLKPFITTIADTIADLGSAIEQRLYGIEERLDDFDTAHADNHQRIADLENEDIDERIAQHLHHHASSIADQLVPFLPDPEIDFADLAEHITIDIDEVAHALDASEIAQHVEIEQSEIEIDYSELAHYIDVSASEIADHVELSSVAEWLDLDHLASRVADQIADRIAEKTADDRQAQRIAELESRLEAQERDLRLVLQAAEAFASALRPGEEG